MHATGIDAGCHCPCGGGVWYCMVRRKTSTTSSHQLINHAHQVLTIFSDKPVPPTRPHLPFALRCLRPHRLISPLERFQPQTETSFCEGWVPRVYTLRPLHYFPGLLTFNFTTPLFAGIGFRATPLFLMFVTGAP